MHRINGRLSWLIVGAMLTAGALSTGGFSPLGNESTVGESSTVDDTSDPEGTPPVDDTAGTRKMNHGYFVSRAAHCEDVADATTGLTFTAPEDCTGSAKGEYVSSVARSGIGKKSKENGKSGEEHGKPTVRPSI